MGLAWIVNTLTYLTLPCIYGLAVKKFIHQNFLRNILLKVEFLKFLMCEHLIILFEFDRLANWILTRLIIEVFLILNCLTNRVIIS